MCPPPLSLQYPLADYALTPTMAIVDTHLASPFVTSFFPSLEGARACWQCFSACSHVADSGPGGSVRGIPQARALPPYAAWSDVVADYVMALPLLQVMNMPKSLTAFGGVDALVHALERCGSARTPL